MKLDKIAKTEYRINSKTKFQHYNIKILVHKVIQHKENKMEQPVKLKESQSVCSVGQVKKVFLGEEYNEVCRRG